MPSAHAPQATASSGERDTHAGKRPGTSSAANGGDGLPGDARLGQQPFDLRDELGVRSPAGRKFPVGDQFDRAGIPIQPSKSDRNGLVGCIEHDHIGGAQSH